MRSTGSCLQHKSAINTPHSRARYLLYLLRAESLAEDHWRLPGGAILSGTPHDLARSVDYVKRLEAYAYSRQDNKVGEDGLLVSVEYTGAGWNASITPFLGAPGAYEGDSCVSEAHARIEALIDYVRNTR